MKQFYLNDDDTIVYVGNSAEENQQLLEESCQNDIWLHLKNNPSPHGIIKNMKNKYDITFAAKMVKENSKLKNLDKVKVIYIERKHVKMTKENGKVVLKKKCKEIIV